MPSVDPRQALLDGPVLPTLFRLTIPVIAVIAAQTFVAVLEAYWVSRLGTAAVAGVALAIPLYVLMNTMSNGGIGGGVAAAVARAIGRGQPGEADALLLHAMVIALGFGAGFAALFAGWGNAIYRTLGGTGEALLAADTYSAWVFGAAPVIWCVNLAASAMRGAGEVKLPAQVSLIGALVLVPLSPALIFGIGPIPPLGVAGAGLATLIYYFGALAAYGVHLRRGGSLRLRRAPLQRAPFAQIMGVGTLSAIGTLVASLTVVGVTGAVGTKGAAALAGFGIASRVDSLIVPLLFGLGSGVVTMVGTAVGAKDGARADAVTIRAAAIGALAAQAVGLAMAIWPERWMGLFSTVAEVDAAGLRYLRIVAPAYGLFGLGLMLYFAAQGRGRMLWPFAAGGLRLVVTVGLATWLAAAGAPLDRIFVCVALGSVLFGTINLGGLLLERWAAPDPLT